MRPLAYPLVRWLLLANILSEIGTWTQFVGAEWLMTSQTLDPLQVSLLGVAYRLPLFLLGIPAGIWGDTFGRRKVLLAAQYWMMALAFAMVCMLRLNMLGPWALIFMTFALFCGIILQGPALHAVYPELVPPKDSPAAIVLHSVAFNCARVIGPALGGAMIRWWGLASAFTANVLSFGGLIWFLLAWRPQRGNEHRDETFGAACKGGFDYVRASPAVQLILVFAALQAFFAVAAEVLTPIMARSKLHLASDGLGLLLSCMGVGSILGAILVAPALDSFPATRIMSAGLFLSSISLFAFSRATRPLEAGLFLFANAAGGAIASTLIFAMVQRKLADWARSRVMGFCLMILYGGSTAGSAAIGWLARVTTIEMAQAIASVCLLLLAVLVVASRLQQVLDRDTDEVPQAQVA